MGSEDGSGGKSKSFSFVSPPAAAQRAAREGMFHMVHWSIFAPKISFHKSNIFILSPLIFCAHTAARRAAISGCFQGPSQWFFAIF